MVDDDDRRVFDVWATLHLALGGYARDPRQGITAGMVRDLLDLYGITGTDTRTRYFELIQGVDWDWRSARLSATVVE